MTTIAWDGKTLAADKQQTINNRRSVCSKIQQNLMCAIACSGSAEACRLVEEWALDANFNEEKRPSVQTSVHAIFVGSGSVFYIFGDKDNKPAYSVVEDDFFAVGSGAAYALAAMHLGEIAEQAIAVAAAFDIHTGMGVDTWRRP